MTVHAAPTSADFPMVPCCGRTLRELPDNDTVAIRGGRVGVNCPGPVYDPKELSSPDAGSAGMTGGPTSVPDIPGLADLGPVDLFRDEDNPDETVVLRERAERGAQQTAEYAGQIMQATGINPISIELMELRSRIDLISDAVFGDGTAAQHRFEIDVQGLFRARLDEAVPQVQAAIKAKQAAQRRATLLDGVSMPVPRPGRP